METATTCRCCLVRPPDKDLKRTYFRLGKTEVYADMLKECFEIHLPPTLQDSDPGICDVCVMRLRDASDFKHQVLHCQKELQMIAAGLIKGETKVKEEITEQEDPNEIAFMELKEELYEDPGFQDEDDMKLAEFLNLDGLTVKRKKKNGKKRLLLGDAGSERKIKKTVKITIPRISRKEELNPKFVTLTEAKKHQKNIETLLKHANCIPFTNKNLSGIICGFCRQTLPSLQSLRTHTESTHSNESLIEKFRDKSNLSIKMDITDLKCKICQTQFDVITNLKKHLINEHQIKFYTDVNDYILEFKLTDDKILNCALCNSTFETFKMLLQHMNGHYRNYICEVCDLGFINKHRLRNHQRTHEIGDFQCSFCDKIFTTRVRKMCHEKYTHNSNARYTTNCPHCDESFNSYYQRNRHMFKEHNTTAATYRCNICEKSFILKSKLTSHIKKVHLMERNHICPECGQGFFIKQSLDEHMIKHNGERVFKCTVCHKAYARKKTLREHMRIHNNDRRFKCGVCGLAFVQKCSLKSHMLSNHGVTLAEFENAKDLSSPNSITVN